MNKQIEALKIALQYIKESEFRPIKNDILALIIETIALAEAEKQEPVLITRIAFPESNIQKPAQEPVAWRVLIDEAPQDIDWFYMTGQCWDVFKRFAEPLYTRPATWNGLSKEEKKQLRKEHHLYIPIIEKIEAILKEKNHA